MKATPHLTSAPQLPGGLYCASLNASFTPTVVSSPLGCRPVTGRARLHENTGIASTSWKWCSGPTTRSASAAPGRNHPLLSLSHEPLRVSSSLLIVDCQKCRYGRKLPTYGLAPAYISFQKCHIFILFLGLGRRFLENLSILDTKVLTICSSPCYFSGLWAEISREFLDP